MCVVLRSFRVPWDERLSTREPPTDENCPKGHKVNMAKSTKERRRMIYETVRREIINRTFNGGERISEIELSERFNVSRTPIREVLRQLETDGLVNYVPNIGVTIIKVTPKMTLDYFKLASIIEAGAVESAIENGITKQEIAHLKEINDLMQQGIDDSRIEDYESHNIRFHAFFLEKLDNPIITALIKDLKIKMYMMVDRLPPIDDAKVYILSHKAIVEHIENNDSIRAGREMRNHILEIGKGQLRRYEINRYQPEISGIDDEH